MKSKLFAYTQGCVLLLLLSLVWGGAVGCSPSGPSPSSGVDTNYISVGLSLRSQEDNTNSLNKDLLDEEDKVHELRIMLFQGGDLKYNLCYNVPGGTGVSLAFNADPSVRKAIFKLPKPGMYDMVVIANEQADASQGPSITSSLNGIAHRSQLNNIRITVPTIYQAGVLPNIKLRSPMTAEYKNVDMTQVGTQVTPAVISLPTPSHGVELLRAMAKVELILKDMVEIAPASHNPKKYEIIGWIGTGVFDRVCTVQSINMPKTFFLMPQNLLTPDTEIASGVFNNIALPSAPDPKSVIDPVSIDDEPSIGGILTADYRLAFYVPEHLAKTGLATNQQPLLKFTYKYKTGDWWDPHSTLSEKKADHVMKNPNLSAATKYLDEIVSLHGGSVVPSGEYSVYRNSCYRISVRFQKI